MMTQIDPKQAAGEQGCCPCKGCTCNPCTCRKDKRCGCEDPATVEARENSSAANQYR